MELIYSIIPVVCFIAGFIFGIKLNMKHDVIELPEVKSPAKIVKEKKEDIEQNKYMSDMANYLDNIDNYPNNQIKF